MILGINTASKNTKFAILRNNKILKEKSWISNANESEKLLPLIKNSAQKLNLELSSLKKILVINGPGFYTSIRVGITIANALSYILKIPIYSINLFDLYRLKIKQKKDYYIVFHANKNEVFASESNSKKHHIYKTETFFKKNHLKTFCGELDQETIKKYNLNFIKEKELLNFGEAIKKINFNKLESSGIIKPLYFKKPNITKSKKPLSYI